LYITVNEIVIPISDLRATAARRPAGYESHVLSMAIWVSETHYELSQDSYHALVNQYRFSPLVREQWGWSAKALASLAIPADKGLGDVVARKFGSAGKVFQRWFKKLMGFDCGCDDRQQWLNLRYPLK
jgi:hypothetical protein